MRKKQLIGSAIDLLKSAWSPNYAALFDVLIYMPLNMLEVIEFVGNVYFHSLPMS